MQMIEGKEGLFEMETEMPYDPAEFSIPRYVLPSTYGRMETEEAAARLIIACQEAGTWVGVSVPALFETMKKEFEAHAKAQEIQQEMQKQNSMALCAWKNALRRRFWFSVLTLGLFALIVKKPERPDRISLEIEPPLPFSGTYIFGPDLVFNGFAELKEKGLVEVERHDEGFEVVFPTAALLEPIDKYRRAKMQ